MLSGNADRHTSDIGHWFAMTKTDFVYSLKRSLSAAFFVLFEQQAHLLPYMR